MQHTPLRTIESPTNPSSNLGQRLLFPKHFFASSLFFPSLRPFCIRSALLLSYLSFPRKRESIFSWPQYPVRKHVDTVFFSRFPFVSFVVSSVFLFSPSFISFAHSSGHFDLVFSGLDGLALIRSRFTSAQTQLQFCQSPFEVNIQRDQGIALLLNVLGQVFNLSFVYQQFSGPGRLMVSRPSLFVDSDIDAAEKQLIISVDSSKTFIEADLAVTNTLYFCAQQLHSSFEGLQHEVVVVSLAIDHLWPIFGFLFCLSCHSFTYQPAPTFTPMVMILAISS